MEHHLSPLLYLEAGRDGDGVTAVRTEVGDVEEAVGAGGAGRQAGECDGGTTARLRVGRVCCARGRHGERVRGGGGALLPLDPAVARLGPDAVGVVVAAQQLAARVVVALHTARPPSEELGKRPLNIEILDKTGGTVQELRSTFSYIKSKDILSLI